jgi:insertion element IS1 protein InsB
VDWVLGGRDTATFRRFYDKVKHPGNCKFYTYDWAAFSKVLPKERHFIGKQHTHAIERDNSNTRHHLGRFTRRTKGVSHSTEMVHYTLKIWYWVNFGGLFHSLQEKFLSIF